ncbi:DNA polymerase sigma [Clostridium aceticum]|uniref:DNA polymerase sigma n=1 Tax=Clostridium aceticum TaxID=84022 RepID=A0A0D8IEQ1_9CLOT|nr:nucleotidyltransferase domain-containing protein [Clostridium aceticum]AKL94726.1 DNA polymerase sigma [Clostridium aceticum]KJF27681.1 nucleotidyltransferase [Clostridium aceticum]
MTVDYKEIEKIRNQINSILQAEDIILFGSYAKGVVSKKSDIDLCIVVNTNNKRKLMQEILLKIDIDIDIDIVIYTLDEWEKYKNDHSTFANVILRTGVSISG